MDGMAGRREAGPAIGLIDLEEDLVTTRIRRLLALAAALVGLLMFASCGGGDDNDSADTGSTPAAPAAKGVFVGKAGDSGAYVALVSDGKEVTGYVCNGTAETKATDLAWVWLKPTSVAAGKATLENRKGETVGTVSFADGAASGNVTVAGQEESYSAELAKGDAGLYRATKGEWDTPGSLEAGWIVLADGTQRGALGTYGKEGADAGGGASQAVRFVSHLPVILESVPSLNTAVHSINLGAAGSVPVQSITNVGTLRVAQPIGSPEAGAGSRSS
jgi:hypothetical protein